MTLQLKYFMQDHPFLYRGDKVGRTVRDELLISTYWPVRFILHNSPSTGRGGLNPHNSHNFKMYKFILHLHIFFMYPCISHPENFNNILLRMSCENNIMRQFT